MWNAVGIDFKQIRPQRFASELGDARSPIKQRHIAKDAELRIGIPAALQLSYRKSRRKIRAPGAGSRPVRVFATFSTRSARSKRSDAAAKARLSPISDTGISDDFFIETSTSKGGNELRLVAWHKGGHDRNTPGIDAIKRGIETYSSRRRPGRPYTGCVLTDALAELLIGSEPKHAALAAIPAYDVRLGLAPEEPAAFSIPVQSSVIREPRSPRPKDRRSGKNYPENAGKIP